MNYYILDAEGNVVNFVVWDGVTPVNFGGTPVLEEDYIAQHPELFSSENI